MKVTGVGGPSRGPIPIPLRREVDLEEIRRANPCDELRLLGSFWPNTKSSFESHVVKSFKESVPARDFEPHITNLCRFYASLVGEAVRGEKIDWVARVLSSAEMEPDGERPLARLAEAIRRELGARDATGLFFKTISRPSMRNVKQLSGPDALKNRMAYVVQDFFIRPQYLGGHALLIDDIFNTGASARVYAHALKRYAGVEKVISVNLAATRFHGGKDGLGMLRLDLAGLDGCPDMAEVWLDESGMLHRDKACPALGHRPTSLPRFVAERKGSPCGTCHETEPRTKQWWRFGF